MNHQPNKRPVSRKEIATRRAKARRRRAKRRAILSGLLILLLVIVCTCIALLIHSCSGKTGNGTETADPSATVQPADTADPVDTSVIDSVGGTASSETEPSATNAETAEPTDTKPETSKPETTAPAIPEVTFTADLSQYEQYMNPTGEKRDAYLLLVNPDHPLTEDDTPTDLTNVSATRKDGRNTQKMRKDAAMALEAMFLEADALGHLNKSTGYQLSVTSAYRSYSYQNQLFTGYVADERAEDPSLTQAEAEAIVEKYSCRAGTSEHQTGLCADLHNQAAASSSHPERFANTPEGQWIHQNAWKFGFVLRFPQDKVDVTGIKYESWHFRYVGRYHAYQMTQLNLCLEEYVEYLAEQA